MCEDIINSIKSHKLIVIVRNVAENDILPLANAIYDGGIRLIEVTFNQKAGADGIKATAEAIRAIRKNHPDMSVGAGTVLTEEQVHIAADAGAEYIISPNANPDIIELTGKLNLISMPGALTPTEIEKAYSCGADFVKLFPADTFGLPYARAVMAPLNHIPLIAVGGVDETNLTDFLSAGFCGAGIGGNIVKSSFIREQEFDKITVLAKSYVNLIERWSQQTLN